MQLRYYDCNPLFATTSQWAVNADVPVAIMAEAVHHLLQSTHVRPSRFVSLFCCSSYLCTASSDAYGPCNAGLKNTIFEIGHERLRISNNIRLQYARVVCMRRIVGECQVCMLVPRQTTQAR